MMNMENQIPAAKSILLFGISNVGKTTVGQLLAAELGYKFYDLDEETKLYCHMTLEEFVNTISYYERDKIRENIQALPAQPDSYGLIAYRNKWSAPLTDTAKRGLLEGLGITTMEDDNGFYNVKIGFDGYNELRTRKYPKGQPNQLIARSIESGTSISEKRPFVTPAIRATRKEAQQAMANVIDEETEKIMK